MFGWRHLSVEQLSAIGIPEMYQRGMVMSPNGVLQVLDGSGHVYYLDERVGTVLLYV